MRRDVTRSRTLPLPGAIAAVVLATVVLMAIASLQGVPQFHDIGFPRPQLTRLPPSAPPQTPGALPGWLEFLESPVLQMIAGIIGTLIVVIAVLLGLWTLWRWTRRFWDLRPMRRQAGAAARVVAQAAATEEAVDEVRIRTGAAAAQEAIDAHADPTEAIVAAWVRLEDAAERAGSPRAAVETPGEFTARILRRRAGFDRETETLLELYESVRFGGRIADEEERATARRCLAAIEEGWR
ncbi:DUF4129 domain-containing protein [Microbacterium sp. ASV81]|uniref:DUF4129 domain-containing protein n=1 Tax=Microbacterium capsulatum TaxID=3041921 RepID=A0ABU0XE59_9MICO|nr:DUF4129 domain-containing protein [Microbacterium sp. ASV81]MDQ4213004.1 DUF4129 domain-containing protein [Microbacterium sp. ASV81]